MSAAPPRLQEQPRDAEAVRRAAEEVFAREEFGRDETLLRRFLDWLSGTLGLGDGVGEDLTLLIVGVLAAAFVLLVVFVLWRQLALRRRSLRAHREQALARGEDSRRRAAELRARARTAHGDGDLRLALRLYFWALVVGLGERGDLQYRDAWTNRELLLRGSPPPALHALLQPLVDELEGKDFGREPTTEADVARLAALCDERLGGGRAGVDAA